MSKSFKAELVFIVILQILSLIMVIVTGTILSYVFLIFTILLMLYEIRKIKKYGNEKVSNITHIKFVIKTLFVAFILITSMCIFPLTFSSSLKWKYPLQKFYINVMTSNVKFPDYFPEYIPQSAKNYRLEYIQSMMQGTGHSSVEFTADSKIISEYENEFSQKAIMTFELAEYVNKESLFNEAYKEEMMKNGGNKFSSMSFYYDKNFVTENDSTKVYILESAFNCNHPHTSAVIIDSRNNRVQFSRLG